MIVNHPKIWTIIFEPKARKALKKLDPQTRDKIISYLEDHIKVCYDPRQFGHGLKNSLKGLWRYRVEDYRVICRFEDEAVKILVINMGHRSRIYDDLS